MSTYLIVEGREMQAGLLYISQLELDQVLINLRSHTMLNSGYYSVYALEIDRKNNQYNPPGCASLSLVGKIYPPEKVEHYRSLLAIEIGDMPLAQAEIEVQKVVDKLNNKLGELRGRVNEG